MNQKNSTSMVGVNSRLELCVCVLCTGMNKALQFYDGFCGQCSMPNGSCGCALVECACLECQPVIFDCNCDSCQALNLPVCDCSSCQAPPVGIKNCDCNICLNDSTGQTLSNCDCEECRNDSVVLPNEEISTCHCAECDANVTSGGFRIVNADSIQIKSNILKESAVSGPHTSLQSFYIHAHNVVKKSGVPNYRKARIEIPSRLNIDAWESKLKDYEDKDLLSFLKFGFPLGYSSPALPASKLKNHSGATQFPRVIEAYLEAEISDNNILGPFFENPLSDLVFVSPLNTVPKKDSGGRRIIADFSYPPGHAINDGIDKNTYLGDHIELVYPSVDSLALELKSIGPGALMFKKDLRKAYRQFKLDPADINFCAYVWEDRLFLDLALVMGARSAAFLCQRVTDAVRYIAAQENVNILNYLDDMCGVAHPNVALECFRKLSEILTLLGLEESAEKSVSPSSQVEFLGILFNSETQTMEVTPERVLEITSLVEVWLDKRSATKRDLQSLIGKLSFVSKCVYGSRIFISRLLFSLKGLKKQHHHFKIGKEFRLDLLWWKAFLASFNGVTYIPDIVWSYPDSKMATDACLTGLGGCSDSSYFSGKFPDWLLKDEPHINTLELLAILVGLRLWFKSFTNLRIQILCDNLASVTVINSGKTKDKAMLRIVREMAHISVQNNFQIRAVHLSGKSNRTADMLSRAHLNPGMEVKKSIDPGWIECELKDELFVVRESW